ncbi:MAG: 1,2-phenylacetyl-CoA epoxidase, subunit E [Steroidobacteraceae bacterium]|nr:1,2-phenylacetyl-CoA epoxidase, subunit E [Steroidobacteraceae bacterium]
MLRFHPLTLESKAAIADDAVCLTFAVPESLREEYRFAAGQHLALRIDAEDGERRTYSIMSPEGSTQLRIGVRAHPCGRISTFLMQRLAVGDRVDVLTPNGSFHSRVDPARVARRVAFAAGSGITPVLSIAATVLEREPRGSFLLFYGNRTAASTMFLDEVMALKNRFPTRLAVHWLFSREPQDIDILNGRIDAAHVRAFARVFFDAPTVDEYFLCGPGSMNDDIAAALRTLGAVGPIHTEFFGAAAVPPTPQIVAPPPAPVAAPGLTRITVTMDGRRRSFEMATQGGETVLEAAERAGLDLPYSCRAGVCSTCRTKVTSGAVAMDQNHALEDWELAEGFVLCCQSRPTSAELEITYDE